ncbi:MAG TPA: T9SS type A sorting domain-containing protein [Bacteroidales bacterium]|nr:T9SS type A sorting domain-containing protein [Bacteroidales bacterium]HPR12835.1 T9SS type A sorting domain-containing protein [Bacteroidales bacterium]
MKKLLISLCGVIMVLYSFPSFAYTGTGTSSDPYVGTVTGNVEWTGPGIYADDLQITDGSTLTISPGTYDASLLIMTGSTLTIEAGGTFILNPNASATISNIENYGTLRLESAPNELGVASLIHDNYIGTGITQVRLYLSGGTTAGGAYKWHYISMPFTGIAPTSFSTLNLAQYVETLSTTTDNYPGWVAYDGYQYSSGTTLATTFNTLDLGKGYNYYSASSTTFTMTGAISIIDEYENLSFSGSSDFQGYNLIGNPFSSCINWQTLVSTPGNVRSAENAIYFTNNGNFAAYVNGVGVAGGTEFIPPLQGFFVKSTASNGRVIFDNAARVHNPDQLRYKKKSTAEDMATPDTISMVRLKLSFPGDSADLVVRLNNKATSNFDNEFDAYTFSRTLGDISMWTTTGNSDYCINGLPFPQTTLEVPIGINMKVAGTFRLSASEINKLDIYNITLKDLNTNQTYDLKKGEYIEFNAPAGMITNRFLLVVSKSGTGIPDLISDSESFRIFATAGRTINVLSVTDEPSVLSGSVTVYDLTGRKVLHAGNVEWSGEADLRQFELRQGGSGLYLVVVETNAGKYVGKVSLK